MSPLLISLLAFIGVSALVGVLATMFRDDGNRTEDRLDSLTGKRKKDDDESTSILKQSAFEKDKQSLLEMLTPNLPSMQRIMLQADCHIRLSTLMASALVLGVLGASITAMAGAKIYFAPATGLIMFLVPFAWLLNKRRARLSRFAGQLPDALELVARALRAGHSLAAGMHVVAEEMPSPISDEFHRVYEEQNLGIPDRGRPEVDVRARAQPRPAFLRHQRAHPEANRRRLVGNPGQDRLRHPRTLPHPGPGRRP